MSTSTRLEHNREQMATMIRELQTNHLILDGLSNSYRVFRFTGGRVAGEPLGLVAMTSYLRCPFAADSIPPIATERYRHLAETIMDLGREIEAGARPRSLRCRYEISARFDRGFSEILELESTLEHAMTRFVADGMRRIEAVRD